MEKVIPTFDEIENTIGGRPPKEKKIRMSFYMTSHEAQILKAIAEIKDTPVSTMVRSLLKNMIHD